MRIFATASILLSLAIAGQSCTTKVDGLAMSEAMTYDNLMNRKIVTGGVVESSNKVDLSKSNTYSQLMRNMFLEEREKIGVIGVNAASSKIGEKKYKKLLSSYQKTGGLSPKEMEQVAKAIGATRFFALARIDSNMTNKGSSETNARTYKDSKGRTQHEPGKVIKTNSRETTVTMHIFDLQKKDVAFTGSVTKRAQNSNSYEKNMLTGIASIVSAAKGNSQDNVYPTPKAPATTTTLKPIFLGFAQNFPEEP